MQNKNLHLIIAWLGILRSSFIRAGFAGCYAAALASAVVFFVSVSGSEVFGQGVSISCQRPVISAQLPLDVIDPRFATLSRHQKPVIDGGAHIARKTAKIVSAAPTEAQMQLDPKLRLTMNARPVVSATDIAIRNSRTVVSASVCP
jgi:hypothetical protein